LLACLSLLSPLLLELVLRDLELLLLLRLAPRLRRCFALLWLLRCLLLPSCRFFFLLSLWLRPSLLRLRDLLSLRPRLLRCL
jgi:hypothetical protein